MDILSLDVLQPAAPSVQLALEHVDSDDFFQQLLSIDPALEALRHIRNTLRKCQPTVSNGNDVDGLISRFEELQTAARFGFSMRARPRLRNLNILDLPDELLLKIFDHFSGLMGSDRVLYCRDMEVDVKTIQNARLTCRRLCDISSHLLVPCLRLSLSPSSLERLEQVTRHPTISRGQRVFKINVGLYSAAIANDLRRFASMCYQKVRHKTEDLERSLEDEEDTFANHYGSDPVVRTKIEKSRRILSRWEPLTNGEQVSDDAELDEAILALQKGHERYRELFEQQERRLENGPFARIIAAAAARSRSRVWLFMSDVQREIHVGPKPLWDPFDADPELLADPGFLAQSGLLQPPEWSDVIGDEADEAPQSLLYSLPLEMREAGASLVGFRVSLSMPGKLNLRLSNDQLAGLSEVAKNLWVFDFAIGEGETEACVQSNEEVMDLFSYLSAAMGPQNVPKLSLSLCAVDIIDRELYSDPELLPSIGPLLTSSAWPRLKTICLQSCLMHLRQLRKLLGMLDPGTCIELYDIELMSGTWEDALDCIRSKAGRGSRLESAFGAETDYMLRRDYLDVFELDPTPWENGNMATQYINSREGIKNPLRKDVEAPEANL